MTDEIQHFTDKVKSDNILESWTPLLDHPGSQPITDPYKRACTAIMLENTKEAQAQEAQAVDGNFLMEAGGTANPAHSSAAGNVQNWNPVLFSLLRRAAPNLMAYDVCGVQPMTGPTGLVFSLRSLYKDGDGKIVFDKDGNVESGATEAQFQEVDSSFSGTQTRSKISRGITTGDETTARGTLIVGEITLAEYNARFGTGFANATAWATATGYTASDLATDDASAKSAFDARLALEHDSKKYGNNPDTDYGPSGLNQTGTPLLTDGSAGARKTDIFGSGFETSDAEELGTDGQPRIPEMSLQIVKSMVEAKSRALKAEYTIELAQDLKAIHTLDAESELSNILSTEILAEMNREVIRTIGSQAKLGAQTANISNKGIFDLSLDADGRHAAEKFKGLLVQIELEANAVAKETRRGRGNVIICSSNAATVLKMTGMLDYSPKLANSLQVDDTGQTFAGMLFGRVKVFIDPYAQTDYLIVGYKGTSPFDAGVYFCPYVPLSLMRAVGEQSMQPKLGFKTRYGMVSNPFVDPTKAGNRTGLAPASMNQFYRIFRLDNILT